MVEPVRRPTLTESFFKVAAEEGRVPAYVLEDPTKGYKLYVPEGSTLMGIARQMAPLINLQGNIVDTVKMIADNNGLLGEDHSGDWREIRLAAGQPLYIPLPPGVEVQLLPVIKPDGATPDLAGDFAKAEPTSLDTMTQGFIAEGKIDPALARDPERVETIIKALNNNMPDDALADSLYVPGIDDFAHVSPLRPPAIENAGALASLFVTEPVKPGDTAPHHMEHCYSYAMGYGLALDPGAGRPLIFGVKELDFSTSAADIRNIPFRNEKEYVVLSQSYAYPHNADNAMITDHADLNLETVNFVAAGNYRKIAGSETMVAATDSQIGPRSYIVGAVHEINGKNVLADYSSAGADILAPPLPLLDGQYAGGTSYATPVMAAIDREMLERYGGLLTQEEIFSAALMSTDMNLTQSDGKPVNFRTNGGGQPHDLYAGAGMIDPQRWQGNLDTMAAMKLKMEYVPGKIDHAVTLQPEGETQNVMGGTIYAYSVPISEDMTLDRLSFVLPREDGKPPAGIWIESPSGFHIDIPDSVSQGIGTSAFALEDVKQGQELKIYSDHPLRKDSFVEIRGLGDGNVVQTLRDKLQQDGQIPRPNTDYVGAQTLEDYAATRPAPLNAQNFEIKF